MHTLRIGGSLSCAVTGARVGGDVRGESAASYPRRFFPSREGEDITGIAEGM